MAFVYFFVHAHHVQTTKCIYTNINQVIYAPADACFLYI